MTRSILLPAFLLSCVSQVAIAASQATAIDSELDVPLLAQPAEREKAEPEPLVGLTVGGQTGVYFKDNIYRSNDHRESDVIGYVAPGFTVRGGNDKVAGKIGGQFEAGGYADNPKNDYLDAAFLGEARYQASDDTALSTFGHLRHDHIEIGAFVDDPEQLADEPTEYNYADGGVGVDSYFGGDRQWLASASSELRYYNYENVDRTGGGRIINDDRDRGEWYNMARLGNYIQPGVMPYIEAGYNVRDYDKKVDETDLNGRDSHGYDGLVGVQLGTLRDMLRADLAAGYMAQEYHSDVRDDVDGLKVRATVTYAPDPWLSFHGGVDRSIEENTLRGSSGYTRTRIGAGANYYFQPKWSIGTELHYTNFDFHINPAIATRAKRNDDVYDASVLLSYDLTDIYKIGAEYVYVTRDSQDPQLDFDSNTALVRLSAAF